MPAITVDDVLVLPRVPAPDPATTTSGACASLTTAPSGFEGEGFPVKRAFAGVDLAALDPFVHMDQMGEVEWAPGAAKGTAWHPHRGFETVTYMLDGVIQHEDSHGGGGVITDGDTQWMTAGSGLLHKEAPPADSVARGGLFQGVQLWVNLPARLKMSPPRYQDIRGGAVTLLTSHDGGAPAPGHRRRGRRPRGPWRHPHAHRAPPRHGAPPAPSSACPGGATSTRSVWAFSGSGTVGGDQRAFHGGQLAVLGAGDVVTVTADAAQDSHTPALEVLVLGGLPDP